MKEEDFVEWLLRNDAIKLLEEKTLEEKELLDPSNTFKSEIKRRLNEQGNRRKSYKRK